MEPSAKKVLNKPPHKMKSLYKGQNLRANPIQVATQVTEGVG
jgi:hypothetical protein